MAALDPETLIEAARVVLVTVSGIDATTVHKYRREVRDESEARDRWYSSTQNRINSWGITLQDAAAKNARGPGFSRDGSSKGRVLTDFGLAVEGVFGISDADQSEVTFRALCWGVSQEFNGIGAIHANVVHQEAFQWERFGYLILAGVFPVHFARFTCRFTGQSYP